MTPAQFGRTPSEPEHDAVTTQSLHVAMRDGTQIAADVMRPAGLPPEEKLPTVLFIARYWRSFALRGPTPRNRAPVGPRNPLPAFLLARGYAVVIADSRGSGASTGSTPYPFSPEEIRDYGELVDWVVEQPWSDGRVGATGISYEGIAAELLTTTQREAVKVVVPQQADIDQYAEFLFPGGIRNEWMVNAWQRTNEKLDRNEIPPEWSPGDREGYSLIHRVVGRLSMILLKGVRPVDEDPEGSLLAKAIADHRDNADVAAYARTVTYRDDPFGASGVSIDDLSTIRYQEEIQHSGTPLFTWGSWLDGSTADGVLRRFVSYSNPQRAVIGAWSHGYVNHGSPYRSPTTHLEPRIEELWQELVDYFDLHLKGRTASRLQGKELFYFTMGEEEWKVTDLWPPKGATTERWYLADAAGLDREPPKEESASDRYTVDFEATTGRSNRWRTQDGVTKVIYGDRAQGHGRLLTYTSPPLAEDMEVTGHPVITLHVASTHSDGAFYVYLEDVDEEGRAVYLTEGQLRAIHRRVSDASPPLRTFVPHRSFRREDALPLEPGEVAELRFGLLPVSARIPEGHRLRVAIAGHDAHTFLRIPEEGTPTVTVHRSRAHPSHIEVPVVKETRG